MFLSFDRILAAFASFFSLILFKFSSLPYLHKASLQEREMRGERKREREERSTDEHQTHGKNEANAGGPSELKGTHF
jgi:hypothetical protein